MELLSLKLLILMKIYLLMTLIGFSMIVNAHLKKVSYVAKYRAGEFGEGDAGVTIVEFK